MANPPASDDGGIRIVLTPLQLAAILQQTSITPWQAAANRFWGALAVIGGAVDMVVSVPLWLAPEPTLATKVGAGALDYIGADVAATGLRQVWTGRQQKTFTAQAVQSALHSLGVDPDLADKLGNGTDAAMNVAAMIAIPLAEARALNAVRVLSIDQGLIDLEAEEAAGGHTIARHVGKDLSYLSTRLTESPRLQAASSFTTLRSAEVAVSDCLRVNAASIEAWAASTPAEGARLVVTSRGTAVTGQTLLRGSTSLRNAYGVRVVLSKTLSLNKVYYVLTAYPEL
jgi:hypothetical protein